MQLPTIKELNPSFRYEIFFGQNEIKNDLTSVEEDLYLKQLKKHNKNITKIIKVEIFEDKIKFIIDINKCKQKIYILDTLNCELIYTINYGKTTIKKPFLEHLTKNITNQTIININDHNKTISQHLQENPNDDFSKILSKFNSNFVGSVFTNWEENLSLFDDKYSAKCSIPNFYTNPTQIISEPYSDFNMTESEYNENLKDLVKHIKFKGRNILYNYNEKMYKKYNININFQQNIQQNFQSNIQINNNTTNKVKSIEISVPSIVFKIFNSNPNLFIYDGKHLLMFNVNELKLWKEIDYSEFSNIAFLQDDFKQILNEDECLYLLKNSFSTYKNLCSIYLNNNIKFDRNTHLIPLITNLGGKILDLNKNCLIDSTPDLFCKLSVGWNYDENLARQYKYELKFFLNKTFNDQNIQDIVLFYIYKTLMGEKIKKILVLTDNLHGNNGKSTFMDLIWTCFGHNYVLDGKKYFIKANVRFNLNNHDAGLYNLKDVRFLMVNECSDKVKINDDFVKNLADPVHFTTGRQIHSDEKFFFNLLANAMLSCNNNKFFKFDTTDEAFFDRFLIVQMQSKFDLKFKQDDWENLQFAPQIDIMKKFTSWRSAFIDILLDVGARLDLIHQSIYENEDLIKWKCEFLSTRIGISQDLTYEFDQWLKLNLEQTDDNLEWVNCNDLRLRLKGSEFEDYFKKKNFISIVKNLLKQLNIEVVDRFYFKLNDRKCERKNIIKGYKLKL